VEFVERFALHKLHILSLRKLKNQITTQEPEDCLVYNCLMVSAIHAAKLYLLPPPPGIVPRSRQLLQVDAGTPRMLEILK
jgi:hypothetical protein